MLSELGDCPHLLFSDKWNGLNPDQGSGRILCTFIISERERFLRRFDRVLLRVGDDPADADDPGVLAATPENGYITDIDLIRVLRYPPPDAVQRASVPSAALMS